ncbi:MAG: hypothetical protein CME71_07985 [Halobacteriovorax sp.]|nr:hypothetical protein [Halobacteriovorax sp.]|tara:strand:+ start:668 stop:940 length:273 start_codon:yes stop_codon:yes gene_type:complete
MKLYPSFERDQLIFVGHGLLPWLYREKWILGHQLQLEKKVMGNLTISILEKDTMQVSLKRNQLKVMGSKVVAKELLALQLHKWIEQWKQQ